MPGQAYRTFPFPAVWGRFKGKGAVPPSLSLGIQYLITPFFCLPRLRARLTLSCLFSSDISRAADISLKIYLRSEANSGTSGKNDPYMGSVKIRPEFTNFSKLVSTTFLHIFIQMLILLQNIYDSWYDLIGGTGQIQISVTYRPSTVRIPPTISIDKHPTYVPLIFSSINP